MPNRIMRVCLARPPGALRWTSPGLPPTFLLSLSNVGPVVYSGGQWRAPPEEPIPRLDLHFLHPFQFQIVLQAHSQNVAGVCRNTPRAKPRLHSSSLSLSTLPLLISTSFYYLYCTLGAGSLLPLSLPCYRSTLIFIPTSCWPPGGFGQSSRPT